MSTESYPPEDELRRLYNEERLSTQEIADRYPVTATTIRRKMIGFGIDRRTSNEMYSIRDVHPQFYTNHEGYELVHNQHMGGSYSTTVHRLVAIAHGTDPHKLFCDGYHTHHKNRIPWDNRPDNLEVMSQTDHAKHHAPSGPKPVPVDSDEFRSLWYSGKTIDEIAEYYGKSDVTVQNWAGKLDFVRKADARPWNDPELLHELYVEDELKQSEIADLLGCSQPTITNMLQKHEIKRAL